VSSTPLSPPLGPAPGLAPGTGADPDLVAAVVAACPGVARLSAGPVGEVATYLPGRRVAGVRVRPGAVEVHVVGWYGPTAAEIAGQVRAAVRTVAGPLPVDVVIDDLDVGGAGVIAAPAGP
jgi:hypothetical protein